MDKCTQVAFDETVASGNAVAQPRNEWSVLAELELAMVGGGIGDTVL